MSFPASSPKKCFHCPSGDALKRTETKTWLIAGRSVGRLRTPGDRTCRGHKGDARKEGRSQDGWTGGHQLRSCERLVGASQTQQQQQQQQQAAARRSQTRTATKCFTVGAAPYAARREAVCDITEGGRRKLAGLNRNEQGLSRSPLPVQPVIAELHHVARKISS